MAGLRAELGGRQICRSDPHHHAKDTGLVGLRRFHLRPRQGRLGHRGLCETGEVYTYEKHGFEATEYALKTDQLGTQLDPPAHWAPEYPALDELPATYAIRPLVVIPIVEQLKGNPNYALQVADIEAWEKQHSRIPEGSVVFVRSDWSKQCPDLKLATLKEFPGVGLDALKFLHEARNILFHGHEPLDTDSTPTLEGEQWLMHHGYAQAEGVANLDKVPETGALVIIGYPKFGGGLGGYARYVAVCPPDWSYGTTKPGRRAAAEIRHAVAL